MKTILGNSRRFSLAALFSLSVHLLAFSPTLLTTQKIILPPPPLKVEMLSPQKLKQYRSVGIKNGSQHFSIPLFPPPSGLSLQSLNPVPAKAKITGKNTPSKKTTKSPESFKISVNDPAAASFLKQSNLSIQFEPPEGVSEDELNDAEKTFWSFKKRAYQTYASSLLRTYRQLTQSQPQIKNTLKKVRNHVIAGKMVFDEKGNVLRIRIIQPSDRDEIQLLFEQSLRNIHKIPNPPKGLLSDKELTLYYQLIINRR